MTLTLTPEIILLLTIIGMLIQTVVYQKRRFDHAQEMRDRLELNLIRAIGNLRVDCKARDEALLTVAQANNAFLAQRAGVPAADITRQLRQQQAMADAEEAVSVYGFPMTDIKEALRAEMEADGPTG